MTSPQTPTERTPLVVGEIPDHPEAQGARGWDVEINGQLVVDPIKSLRLRQRRMGVDVTYGMRPEGFDGLAIHEPEGGGSVTIPYLINPEDGKIYVGVVLQNRPGAGGTVMNVPRGFVDPGSNHDETAVKETHEETGLKVVLGRLIKLGDSINVNTAFFDTSRTTTTGRPEGAAFYALPVRMDEVERVTEENGATHYRFIQEIQQEATGDKTAEGIVGSRFIPLPDAVGMSPDAYTGIAAGMLSAHLIGQSVLQVMDIPKPE